MDILSNILKIFGADNQQNNLLSTVAKLLSATNSNPAPSTPDPAQSTYWQLPDYQFANNPTQQQTQQVQQPPQQQTPQQQTPQQNNQQNFEAILQLVQILIQFLQNRKKETPPELQSTTPTPNIQQIEDSKIEKLKRTKIDLN